MPYILCPRPTSPWSVSVTGSWGTCSVPPRPKATFLATLPTKSLRYVAWVAPPCWRIILPLFWISRGSTDKPSPLPERVHQRKYYQDGGTSPPSSYSPPSSLPAFLSPVFVFSSFSTTVRCPLARLMGSVLLWMVPSHRAGRQALLKAKTAGISEPPFI